MRHIANRLRTARRKTGRRVAGAAVAVLAVLTTIAALGAPSAFAVVPSVGIKTSFEASPISLNQTDAIGYALTNTTGSSQTVTFTDTLPAGAALDNPIGTTNTNGTGTCSLTAPTATPGATAVTVTVTVPSPTASGTVCTISFAIAAGTPSVNDAAIPDSYSSATYVPTAGGGSPTNAVTTPSSLKVLTNPTVTLTAPANGQSFTLGQVFDAGFACAATDLLDSVDTFYGTDDEGNQIQSGAPIDTVDPGPHSLQVDCISAVGGGDLVQTVNYRVGSYALSSLKIAKAADRVSFKTLVPAGKLVAVVFDGKKKVGTTTVKVRARKRVSVTVKPTAAGQRLLAVVKGKAAKVSLQVSFTPNAIGSGDTQISPAAATVVTKSLKLPIAHAAAKKK